MLRKITRVLVGLACVVATDQTWGQPGSDIVPRTSEDQRRREQEWQIQYGAVWSPEMEADDRFKSDAPLVTDVIADIDRREAEAKNYLERVEAFIRSLSPADRQSLTGVIAGESADTPAFRAIGEANLEMAATYLVVPSISSPYAPGSSEDIYIAASERHKGGYVFEVRQKGPQAKPVGPLAFPTSALNEFFREGTRTNFVLTRDILFCRQATGDIYLVPAGFITDRASVPQQARHFFPEIPNETGPAILHDWLYAIGTRGSRPHQREADRIFLEELTGEDVGFLRRNIFYMTVDRGGGSAVGNPKEMRFATRETSSVGRRFAGKPSNAIVGRADCKTFKANYFNLLRKYGTGGSVDIYRIYEDREMREYVRAVVNGTAGQ